ncbi:DMT transporter [Pontimonas salivibrio]|uniref:DMT transporter n=1 Tax=Pontimonas salivibrio TaxID=1159327 RepID=A0A2L2BQE8_9MICO|nr:DMT family transporter [Pontimonas salivibrio]AVG23878.1 DMT transporter [Pontimonas salivibrio]
MSHTRATIMVALGASLWGTTGTVAYLISDTVSAVTVGAITMGVGGVVLALLGGRRALALWANPSLRPVLLAGAAAVTAYPLAFYTGMSLAGVAVGNIVALATGPLVGAVLEWRLERDPPGATWWWALLVGVAGVIVLATGERELTTADPTLWPVGLGLSLLAGVAYGTFSYCLSRIIRTGASSLSATGAVFGAGAVPLLVVMVTQLSSLQWEASSVTGLGYLVTGPMVISYLLYGQGLTHLSSSVVLVIALVEPAVATLLAVGVVGERFGPLGIAGLVAITIAVVLAARARTMRQRH